MCTDTYVPPRTRALQEEEPSREDPQFASNSDIDGSVRDSLPLLPILDHWFLASRLYTDFTRYLRIGTLASWASSYVERSPASRSRLVVTE
jgi:hypothetical protein